MKQEIGGYTKAIKKNKEDDVYFFFIMDGTYINTRKSELDKSRKYNLSTSKTIEKNLEKFIIKNLK